MKNLFISFIFIMVYMLANAQTGQVDELTLNSFTEAVKLFASYVNWLFIFVFMLLSWLINDTADAVNAGKWLSFLSNIPRTVRAIFIGIFIIVVFMWVFELRARMDIFKMFLSLLLAMVIYKLGINKIFAWLSARLGLKFE